MSDSLAEVTTGSGSTMASVSTESKTIRKLQIRLLPFLFLLYVVAYVDRINIGFAALTMNKDLGLTSRQFGLVAGIFFFGYCFFEIPSNLLLHKIGARIWIARILITWGIVAILTGLVRTAHQLYVVRFLLGLAEAGYFPGILLYLTYWFREKEQARAIALIMIGIPVASILGAPVSGLILDHVHWLGMVSWRWLLVLEGIPAVACGVLTYFLLPNRPVEAKFLTAEEKNWIIHELESEKPQKQGAHDVSAIRTLAQRRVWHLALAGFTFAFGSYTLSFWLPQMVKSLSAQYSNSVVGLLVMIPNLVGLAGIILVSRSSDRTQERRYHAAIPAIISGTAFVLLGATSSPLISLVLFSFAALGVFSLVGPFWSLPGEFLSGLSAASGIALVSSITNLAGFAGPYAVGWISQTTGNLSAGLASAGASLFVSAALLLLLPRRASAQPQ